MSHQQLLDFPLSITPKPQSSNCRKNRPSHVKVFCRVKPLHAEQSYDIVIDKKNAEISVLQPRQDTTKIFTFNRIFTNEPQSQFVEECCAPILRNAFEHGQGYLVFSYGVTNSGKTYTILGSQDQPGILPHLISKLNEKNEVFVSAIELYNDDFFSLISKEKIQPREHNGFLDFSQCSVSESVGVGNLADKMKQFINNRTQNETKMNAKSSRSHAIFKIQSGGVTIGVVDLAGSERSNKVFASIDETSNINKSLLCLGRCIKALNEQPDGQNPNIPYRESKLTKVLIEYFAAKTEVLMIANVNQHQSCYHENMKVLDYAVLAKDIRHCVVGSHIIPKSSQKPLSKKLDVFESLYKSAVKQSYAHKSLKSSRTKIDALDPNNMSRKQLQQQNEKFSKALKAQQLKMYLDRYNSSQEAAELYEDQIEELEDLNDRSKLDAIKNSTYHSPNAHRRSTKSIGIGQSAQGWQISEIKKREMKEQLRRLLDQEKLAKMVNQETQMTVSFKKFSESPFSKKEIESVLLVDCTPQKERKESSGSEDKSFKSKVASAYNSTKNAMASSLLSFGQAIMTSMKKSQNKPKPKRVPILQICNYGENYLPIFNTVAEAREETSSITFFEEPNPKQFAETAIQTEDSEIGREKCSLPEETDESEQSMVFEHDSRVSEVSVRESIVVISEKPANDEDETEQNSSQTENRSTENKVVLANDKRTKKQLKKESDNDAMRRRVEIRAQAAKLCREKSRTPLKQRLRSRSRLPS